MEQVTGRTFDAGELVDTDGKEFTDCTFNSAALVYSGGEHPFFERCTFNDGVNWTFLGPALTTVRFLQRIANNGGQNFIAEMFQKGNYYSEEPAGNA
jgi:hypothetical protein